MCFLSTFYKNDFLAFLTICIYFLIVLNNVVTFRTRVVILGHCERWNVLNVGSSVDLVMPVLWAASRYNIIIVTIPGFKSFTWAWHYFTHITILLSSPGSVVWSDLVQVCNGHSILGLLLVVAHAAVLESVAPQDLIWQIWSPHLKIIYLHIYPSWWISRPTTVEAGNTNIL